MYQITVMSWWEEEEGNGRSFVASVETNSHLCVCVCVCMLLCYHYSTRHSAVDVFHVENRKHANIGNIRNAVFEIMPQFKFKARKALQREIEKYVTAKVCRQEHLQSCICSRKASGCDRTSRVGFVVLVYLCILLCN